MAYTVTKTNANLGSINGVLCEVTADAASGTVPTNLGSITSVSLGPKSMASSAIKVSTSGGTVTISNAASGDNFFLHVFGK